MDHTKFDADDTGVYKLVTELCSYIASQKGSVPPSEYLISKMRSYSYELILKSQPMRPKTNPITDLLYCYYIAKKTAKNFAEYNNAAELKSTIDILRQKDYRESETFQKVLKLLTLLSSSEKDYSKENFQRPLTYGLLDRVLPKPKQEVFGSLQPYSYYPPHIFDLPLSLNHKNEVSKILPQCCSVYTIGCFDPGRLRKYNDDFQSFISPISLPSISSSHCSPFSNAALEFQQSGYRDLKIPKLLQICNKVKESSLSTDKKVKEMCRTTEGAVLDIRESATQVYRKIPEDIGEVVAPEERRRADDVNENSLPFPEMLISSSYWSPLSNAAVEFQQSGSSDPDILKFLQKCDEVKESSLSTDNKVKEMYRAPEGAVLDIWELAYQVYRKIPDDFWEVVAPEERRRADDVNENSLPFPEMLISSSYWSPLSNAALELQQSGSSDPEIPKLLQKCAEVKESSLSNDKKVKEMCRTPEGAVLEIRESATQVYRKIPEDFGEVVAPEERRRADDVNENSLPFPEMLISSSYWSPLSNAAVEFQQSGSSDPDILKFLQKCDEVINNKHQVICKFGADLKVKESSLSTDNKVKEMYRAPEGAVLDIWELAYQVYRKIPDDFWEVVAPEERRRADDVNENSLPFPEMLISSSYWSPLSNAALEFQQSGFSDPEIPKWLQKCDEVKESSLSTVNKVNEKCRTPEGAVLDIRESATQVNRKIPEDIGEVVAPEERRRADDVNENSLPFPEMLISSSYWSPLSNAAVEFQQSGSTDPDILKFLQKCDEVKESSLSTDNKVKKMYRAPEGAVLDIWELAYQVYRKIPDDFWEVVAPEERRRADDVNENSLPYPEMLISSSYWSPLSNAAMEFLQSGSSDPEIPKVLQKCDEVKESSLSTDNKVKEMYHAPEGADLDIWDLVYQMYRETPDDFWEVVAPEERRGADDVNENSLPFPEIYISSSHWSPLSNAVLEFQESGSSDPEIPNFLQKCDEVKESSLSTVNKLKEMCASGVRHSTPKGAVLDIRESPTQVYRKIPEDIGEVVAPEERRGADDVNENSLPFPEIYISSSHWSPLSNAALEFQQSGSSDPDIPNFLQKCDEVKESSLSTVNKLKEMCASGVRHSTPKGAVLDIRESPTQVYRKIPEDIGEVVAPEERRGADDVNENSLPFPEIYISSSHWSPLSNAALEFQQSGSSDPDIPNFLQKCDEVKESSLSTVNKLKEMCASGVRHSTPKGAVLDIRESPTQVYRKIPEDIGEVVAPEERRRADDVNENSLPFPEMLISSSYWSPLSNAALEFQQSGSSDPEIPKLLQKCDEVKESSLSTDNKVKEMYHAPEGAVLDIWDLVYQMYTETPDDFWEVVAPEERRRADDVNENSLPFPEMLISSSYWSPSSNAALELQQSGSSDPEIPKLLQKCDEVKESSLSTVNKVKEMCAPGVRHSTPKGEVLDIRESPTQVYRKKPEDIREVVAPEERRRADDVNENSLPFPEMLISSSYWSPSSNAALEFQQSGSSDPEIPKLLQKCDEVKESSLSTVNKVKEMCASDVRHSTPKGEVLDIRESPTQVYRKIPEDIGEVVAPEERRRADDVSENSLPFPEIYISSSHWSPFSNAALEFQQPRSWVPEIPTLLQKCDEVKESSLSTVTKVKEMCASGVRHSTPKGEVLDIRESPTQVYRKIPEDIGEVVAPEERRRADDVNENSLPFPEMLISSSYWSPLSNAALEFQQSGSSDAEIPKLLQKCDEVKESSLSTDNKVKEMYRAPERAVQDIWELAYQVYRETPDDFWEVVARQPVELVSFEEQRLSRGLRTEKQLLEHVMRLLFGIESTTFYISKKRNFFKVSKKALRVWEPFLSSGQLRHILTFGTYHKRIYDFVYNSPLDDASKGRGVRAIYDTVKIAMRGFLLSFRARLLSLSEGGGGLRGLMLRVQPLLRDIPIMARLIQFRGRAPCRVYYEEFYATLFRQVSSVINVQSSAAAFEILVEVCKVYFKFIEKFIFTGEIDNSNFEFFIRRDDASERCRSNVFWNGGFYLLWLVPLPKFLEDLSKRILLCGKTLRLLKICNPNDPLVYLITKNHPRIRCCTTIEQIAQQKAELEIYRTRCRFVGGEPVTFEQILLEKEKERQACADLAALKQAETMEKILAERERLAELMMAEKQHSLRVLRAAMKETIDAKERSRKGVTIFEKLQREANVAAEQVDSALVESEKSNIRTFYSKLNEQVAKKKIYNEWRFKRLQLDQSRIQMIRSEERNLKREKRELQCGSSGEMAMSTRSDIYFDARSSSSDLDEKIVASCGDIIHFAPRASEYDFCRTDSTTKIDEPYSDQLDDQGNIIQSGSETSAGVIGKHVNNAINNQQYLDTRKQALQNRQSVMSHETVTDIENNVTPYVTIEYVDAENNTELTANQEARRNKLKVLGDEFNMATVTGEMKIVEPRTDAQREALANKQKVLGAKYYLPCEAVNRREPANLAQEEALRNKRKVLESEFGLSNVSPTEGTSDAPAGQGTAKRSTLKLELKPVACPPNSSTSAMYGGEDVATPCVVPFVIENTDMLNVETPTTSNDAYIFQNIESGTPVIDLMPFNKTYDCTSSDHLSFSNEVISIANEAVLGDGSDASPTKTFPITPARNDEDLFGLKRIRSFRTDVVDTSAVDDFTGYTHPATIVEEVEKKPLNLFMAPAKEKTEICDNMASLELCLNLSIKQPLTYQLEVVNSSVLTYFLVDLDMYGHMSALKDYIFLIDGDFSTSICNSIFPRLTKAETPEELLNCATLRWILDMAIGSTGSESREKYSDNLTFSLSEVPLAFQHSSPNALQCLSLAYSVRWPLNIILSREALERYSLVYQFLMKLKRVSWVLLEDFEYLKHRMHVPREFARNLRRSPQYIKLQSYRHIMATLIRALDYYIMTTCILGSWREFEEDLKTARTVDDLCNCHSAYLKKVMFRCLLNKRSTPLMKLINDIFTVILKFSRLLQNGSWLPVDGHYKHEYYPKLDELFHIFDQLHRYMHKVISRLQECNYQQNLFDDLLMTLNFNGYCRPVKPRRSRYQMQMPSFLRKKKD